MNQSNTCLNPSPQRSKNRLFSLAFGFTAAVSVLLVNLALYETSLAQDYTLKVHYTKLDKPQLVADPSKPEVIEFFWYGCAHCFKFEPLYKEWKKKNASRYNFIEIPAVWQEGMVWHARAHYVAKALRKLDTLKDALYIEMVRRRNRMNSESLIRRFFLSKGVSEKDFDRAWKSFGVRAQAQKAAKLTRAYELKATPTLIINGKYQLSPGGPVSMRGMFNIAEALIRQDKQDEQFRNKKIRQKPVKPRVGVSDSSAPFPASG